MNEISHFTTSQLEHTFEHLLKLRHTPNNNSAAVYPFQWPLSLAQLRQRSLPLQMDLPEKTIKIVVEQTDDILLAINMACSDAVESRTQPTISAIMREAADSAIKGEVVKRRPSTPSPFLSDNDEQTIRRLLYFQFGKVKMKHSEKIRQIDELRLEL